MCNYSLFVYIKCRSCEIKNWKLIQINLCNLKNEKSRKELQIETHTHSSNITRLLFFRPITFPTAVYSKQSSRILIALVSCVYFSHTNSRAHLHHANFAYTHNVTLYNTKPVVRKVFQWRWEHSYIAWL